MDLSSDIYALVEAHLGDRACFLGDLDLPLQIVAHGRRDDVFKLFCGPDAIRLRYQTSIDDDED